MQGSWGSYEHLKPPAIEGSESGRPLSKSGAAGAPVKHVQSEVPSQKGVTQLMGTFCLRLKVCFYHLDRGHDAQRRFEAVGHTVPVFLQGVECCFGRRQVNSIVRFGI